MTLNANDKLSYSLNKEDTTHSVYQIEIIIGENKLNDTKAYLIYSLKHDVLEPTYKNSSDIMLSKYSDEYGKRTFILKTEDNVNNIIISFFVDSKGIDNSGTIDYFVKYKTVKTEDDIKVYSPEKFTANATNDTLQVNFTELLKDSTEVNNSRYDIKVYLKDDIKDVNLIHSVNSIITPLISFTVTGKNDGKEIDGNFTLPNNTKGIIYVTLMMSFVMKDSEEEKIYYGYKEVEIKVTPPGKDPTNWSVIIILAVSICIIIILIGIFYFIKKKNEEPLIEQINDINKEEDSKITLP